MTEESVKVGVEGDRGAGELRTGEGGKQELSKGRKRSRNKKGTRLLFIAASNPAKNQLLANLFDFHLTRRKIEFHKQENVLFFLD